MKAPKDREIFRITVHTEIEIKAPGGDVWRVLTNLAGYRNWNPMIRHASGDLKPGSRLTVRFNPPGTRGRTFRPKLLVVQQDRELRWQGQPGVPLFFESEHVFILEPISGRSVRLAHDMIFYGLLVPLARNKILRTISGPFNEMNRALKNQAEKLLLAGSADE